jgi:hypothetical protein
MLFFCAKYEGAKDGGCDCVVVKYGALRAVGSIREKREPRSRVAGYIESRRVSRNVGRNGELWPVLERVGEVDPFSTPLSLYWPGSEGPPRRAVADLDAIFTKL